MTKRYYLARSQTGWNSTFAIGWQDEKQIDGRLIKRITQKKRTAGNKTSPQKNQNDRKYIMSDFGANNVFSKGGGGNRRFSNRSVNRCDNFFYRYLLLYIYSLLYIYITPPRMYRTTFYRSCVLRYIVGHDIITNRYIVSDYIISKYGKIKNRKISLRYNV